MGNVATSAPTSAPARSAVAVANTTKPAVTAILIASASQNRDMSGWKMVRERVRGRSYWEPVKIDQAPAVLRPPPYSFPFSGEERACRPCGASRERYACGLLLPPLKERDEWGSPRA